MLLTIPAECPREQWQMRKIKASIFNMILYQEKRKKKVNLYVKFNVIYWK